MAFRKFTDAKGIVWIVMAIHPLLTERRLMRERRDHSSSTEPERRVSDRRIQVRREMQNGWLVFKGDAGLRRFAPIRPDWESCDVAELEAMCEKAIPARRRGDPLLVKNVAT